MRRHVLGSALVLGSLLVGCGVRPAALSTAPLVPALTSAQAAKGSLKVTKVVMPPLAVFATADKETKAHTAWLKTDGHAKWVNVSPILNTLKLSIGGTTAGYLVSVHGTAAIGPSATQPAEAFEGFVISYLIDAKGQLSYTNTLGATTKADTKTLTQPTRTFSKKVGDLSLRMPQGDALPPAIAERLNAMHTAEQGTIAAKFPDGLTLFPTDAKWWNFGTSEIWYQDTMVGYMDDPAAWMWDMGTPKPTVQHGFVAVNVLDPSGGKVHAEAMAIQPTNIAGYKNFAL